MAKRETESHLREDTYLNTRGWTQLGKVRWGGAGRTTPGNTGFRATFTIAERPFACSETPVLS